MKNSKKNIDFEAIENKYDPQLSFRELGTKINIVIITLLVSMSVYHFWASGFGLVREVLHRGIHISFVIGLVFFLFSWKRKKNSSFFSFQNVDAIDYIFAFLAVSSALYLPLLPPEILAQRVGNPKTIDVFMGSILIVLTLEATRRSVGPTLPLISIISYGPKIANKIKIILIKGNVGPTDLRVASSVKTIKIEPINTSILSGLPTLWAKISGGNNGKYNADDTAKNAKM